MRQLPLGVRLRTSATFATFHAAENAPLVAMLKARAATPGLPPVWIWSPPGAGRTHLLQAACANATELGRASAYLPLGVEWLAPEMLAGLEQLALVCLDDVDRVLGDAAWERALFVLHNDLAERGGALVLAANDAPGALPFTLPDLRSRFAAGIVWQVRPLGEDAQPEALLERAKLLGLDLPEETLQYLLRRLPRDYGALCEVLDRLDAAALAEQQRRLTVPFVRSALRLQDD